MKFSLTRTLSYSLFVFVAFSSIYLVSSCSDNNMSESNNSISKKSSFESGNSLYFPQDDGTVLKYVNNQKAYTIILDTEISSSTNILSRTNQNTYRIINPDTEEFFDIFDIVRENEYYSYSVVTSTNKVLTDLRYHGDDFIPLLENYVNAPLYCPPCVAIIIGAVVTVIESLQPSAQELCNQAMSALTCAEGQSPYQEFSDGWFSTSCNVGCR